MSDDPRVGRSVTHRRYVPYSHAHYAGNLVDGAYSVALFGDVATDLMILTDGDEGLFASYSDVQFTAPVRAGDVLEVTATITRVGRRSRECLVGRRGASEGDAAGVVERLGRTGEALQQAAALQRVGDDEQDVAVRARHPASLRE